MDITNLLKNVEIIAVSGKISTGKNYIAEKVLLNMMEPVPTVIMSFADQIKVNGIVQHGLDRYKCFVEKDEHTRKTMQRVGTEEGRNVYGPDIWIRYTLEWMLVHASRGIKRIIIPDVRFYNEFDFIRELGGTLIRVNAPERNRIALEREAAKGAASIESISSHQSETELDQGREFDYVLDNDIGAKSIFIQVRDMIRSMREKNKKDLVIFCDLDNTICECNEYYIFQAEKVKNMIAANLRPNELTIEQFEEMFAACVKKHNGEYSHHAFYMDRFALSMSAVCDDFAGQMKDGVDMGSIKQTAWSYGMDVFDFSYEGIEDRVKQIKELSKLGRVVIFTMGDRLEQVKKIAELQLTDMDIEVYDFKDATIFRHLCNKYPAKMHCMIGDSLQRDVLPAIEAGLPIVIRVHDAKESYWGDEAKDTKGYYEVFDILEARSIIEDRLYDAAKAAVAQISYT